MSETPSAGVQLCDACGKSDTDPMIHVPLTDWKKDGRITIVEPSFHYDCLPAEYRAEAAPVTLEVIEAAESGIKGAELAEFIANQHATTGEEN